ncbi:YdeI/OmpD-associated family protein [Olivibacter sitiensis]|uniref:YdeI/OmpD-associated family protein n=1 Tax=Olivibacter sitiensis TaxID=376470 RepID=UPI00040470EE|nr:YdeI/OmpD-associated family protein [Olivibacter sitiensis]
MVSFTAEIYKFAQNGEKTGWSYIEVPIAMSEQLKPGYRQSFRVRATLDGILFTGLSLTPMGNGKFILALKQEIRKKLGKEEGDILTVGMEEDKDFKVVIPDDLQLCLLDAEGAADQFMKLAPSHRHYFIKWINEAKTMGTRSKRIAMTVDAMEKQWDYGTMIRENRKKA